MNAATETAEITTETTAFQRSVLRAMLELAGSNTSNEIAKQAGVKSEPVRVCLARLRDAGLIGTEVNPDRGGPPLWYLRASVDTVRSMVAAPIPSANDGTPGDDEPAPEPGDTQAVDAAEAAPDPGGWIPWRGGECPVPEGVACWVRLRDGLADICHTPERLFWGRGIDEDNEDDIVAYRPEPKQTGPASFDDPDDFRDGDDKPTVADDPYGLDYDPRAAEAEAVAYGALVEAEAGHDSLPCDACGAEIDGEPRHFSGRVRGEETGHIHLCAACAAPLPVIEVQGGRALAAAAYDATVEAEAKADEAPLAGEDVCCADAVIAEWKREHTPAVPTIAPADPFATWLKDTPAGCAGQRAIDAAEAAAREHDENAEIADMTARELREDAKSARQRGLIVAEIIRFAEQRAGLAGDADPSAVLYAIDELLGQAREAVTGKRVA